MPTLRHPFRGACWSRLDQQDPRLHKGLPYGGQPEARKKTLTLRRRSSQTFLLSGNYQKKYISKGFLNNTVTPTPWYTLLTRWLGLERYWREQEVGL